MNESSRGLHGARLASRVVAVIRFVVIDVVVCIVVVILIDHEALQRGQVPALAQQFEASWSAGRPLRRR